MSGAISTEQIGTLTCVLGFVVRLGLPIEFFRYFTNITKGRSPKTCIVLAILAGWFASLVFRSAEVYVIEAVALAHGDDMYDGVGGNVAELFCG
jgi:hypothetical protein